MKSPFLKITPSDELPSLQSFLETLGKAGDLLGKAKRWVFVIDANAVLKDVHFLACRARTAGVRTAIQECVSAGTIKLVSPRFLTLEVESKLAGKASEWEVEPRRLHDLWKDYASLIEFIETGEEEWQQDPRLAALRARDRNDIPYFAALLATGAQAVLTADQDLGGSGVAAIDPGIALDLRDYSRSKAEELGVTAPAAVVGTVTVSGVGEGAKAIIALARRAPPPLQALILVYSLVVVLNPQSRSRVVRTLALAGSWLRDLWTELEPVVLEIAESTREHQRMAAEALARAEARLEPAPTPSARSE